MNLRVTLGFLVAALVLGGIVFGLDRFNIGPTPTANSTATAVASASLQIINFDDGKVTVVELHQGDNVVRVEKSQDAWTVAGTGEPASRTSFNSLLARMNQLRAVRRAYELLGEDLCPTCPRRQPKEADRAEWYYMI